MGRNGKKRGRRGKEKQKQNDFGLKRKNARRKKRLDVWRRLREKLKRRQGSSPGSPTGLRRKGSRGQSLNEKSEKEKNEPEGKKSRKIRRKRKRKKRRKKKRPKRTDKKSSKRKPK